FMGGLLLLLGLGWFAADPGSWTSCEMLLRLGLGCFQVGAFAVVVVASTGFRQRVVGIAALLGMAALGGFLGPMLGGVAFASSKNSGASLPALISLLVVGVVGVLSTSPHE